MLRGAVKIPRAFQGENASRQTPLNAPNRTGGTIQYGRASNRGIYPTEVEFNCSLWRCWPE
jgi:hypothetical protein